MIAILACYQNIFDLEVYKLIDNHYIPKPS